MADMLGWDLPPGCTQRMIDAANSIPPQIERVMERATDDQLLDFLVNSRTVTRLAQTALQRITWAVADDGKALLTSAAQIIDLLSDDEQIELRKLYALDSLDEG